MSRVRVNNDQPENRRDENVPMPLIREHFEDNGNEIKNKGHVDTTKTNENMRIITLNVKGCRMRNNNRIKEMRESIGKHQIDVALLNEANAKWTTRNVDKIEKETEKIGKGTKVITADSKQWSMTENECLPGGLINVISQKYASIIDSSKIKIGRLGNWIAFSLESKGKRIEIISVCRIPMSS